MKLSEIISPPENVRECMLFLDKQYIPSRYPDSYEEGSPYEYYTKRDGEECLNCAKMILSWVRELLRN
ncbi:MAG: hypothetical protein MjAS7_1795 [Metallosphaera javensis (ex Sakai et al. 2022)]|nr:MAG: hypothetical protein MjAS7_1795 [Metallosphaera javensis (ex Sakai et al. 2022)]